MQSVTRSIWHTIIQTGDTRAVYLSDICRKLGLPLKGQRYLDIGAGTLVNALVLGKDYDSTCCIELKKPNRKFTSRTSLVFALGNAQALPFKDATFDLVSLISVVEHVDDQQQTIYEAFRVLKPGGSLVVQIPNRHFPVDLHSGLPNPLLFPGFIRRPLLQTLGHSRLEDIEIPSRKSMYCLINSAHSSASVNHAKVIWPAAIVSKFFRVPYKVLAWLGILRLLPLGYVFICKKRHPQEV